MYLRRLAVATECPSEWSIEPIVRSAYEQQTELMASDFNIATPYTSLVPSRRWWTARRDPERPPRFGLGVGVRACIKRAKLDQALADGADSRETRELALRAPDSSDV